MSNDTFNQAGAPVGRRRRWLIGLEPIFEGGRHGKRSREWDVEEELIAVALLGDVTIDLAQAKCVSDDTTIEAYAIVRDVDVIVPSGTHVELSGGVLRGDLVNEVPAVPAAERRRTVRVNGHSLLGDVKVRLTDASTN
jgi:predicted membrane protein